MSKAARSHRVSLYLMGSVEMLEGRRLLSGSVASTGVVEGEWVVMGRGGVVQGKRIEKAVEKVGGEVVRELGVGSRRGQVLMRMPEGWGEAEVKRALRGIVRADRVYPEVTTHVAGWVNDPQAGTSYQPYLSGAGTGRIDATGGWDYSTGSGAVVAFLDSGMDLNHPDLAGKVFVNTGEIAGNGIDDDKNGYVDDRNGYDFLNRDAVAMDDMGHGTHVAGIMGAATNNGLGVAGVGYNAVLMPLKMLGADGNGTLSAAIEALNYVAMMRQKGVNVRVVSNSWGAEGYTTGMFNAVTGLLNKDVLVVAAAGNGGADQVGDNNDTSGVYPATFGHANVLSVAASDSSDRLASFSNYGVSSVDLSAPGVGIYSTLRAGGYGYMSGTSMAAPMVAGAAALLFAAKPSASAVAVKEALMSGVDIIAAQAGKTVTGGRLNVKKALAAIGAGAPTVYAPWAPLEVKAAAEGNGIKISWRDNSTNENGFRVYRAVVTNGTVGSYVVAGTVGANVLNWTDTGVTGGVSYAYKVRAYNAGGDSPDSNVVMASVQVVSGALPSPWKNGDVGAVAAAGSASYDGASGVFTVKGSGADVWGSADEFQYVYAKMSGDGEITARVTGLDYTDWAAKAGVMVREGLQAGARNAFAFVTPGAGIGYTRRTASGGQTAYTSGGGQAAIWVKIRRVGTDMEMRWSKDGVNWTWFAWDRFPGLARDVYVGLGVTSHKDGVVAKATFDRVSWVGAVSGAGVTGVEGNLGG